MIKTIEITTTRKKFDEIRQNVLAGLEWCIKKETGGKGSIQDTPYAELADENKEPDDSILASAAMEIVMQCQLHDEYYEAYYEKHPDVEQTEQV